MIDAHPVAGNRAVRLVLSPWGSVRKAGGCSETGELPQLATEQSCAVQPCLKSYRIHPNLMGLTFSSSSFFPLKSLLDRSLIAVQIKLR